METNNTEVQQRFPELHDPQMTLQRIAEAFVAPEYARAALALIRSVLQRFPDTARFGQTTVVTAPNDYDNLIVTLGRWWFLSFHTAEADALEEGEDVEEMVPLDFPRIMEQQKEDSADIEEADGAARAEAVIEGDDDIDEDEIVEATFYQVGTFLLDSTIIPHETIFDREDLDCYAYDYPEDRVEAERFYWARMVWEPEDLANEDLLAAIYSTAEFILTNHTGETPFAEFHDSDFAQLILNESLAERAISAADFGDVVEVGPDKD